jgi:integrase
MSTKARSKRPGSVYHRADGRWCGAADLGMVGGKRQRVVVYAASAKDADLALRHKLDEIEKGIRSTDRRATVGGYLTNTWLPNMKPPRTRPATFKRYADIVRLHLVPELGHIRLEKLTADDVDAAVGHLLSTGLAPRTVHHCRATLRAALARARRSHLVTFNAAGDSDPVPGLDNPEMMTLDPEQARTLLEVVRGDRLEALYTVALALGLRQGEALGLRWQDIDRGYRTLTVSQALQRVDGKLILVAPKTKRSRRTIVLPSPAAEALRSHRARQAEERLLAGGRWQEHDLVFPSTIGTPTDPGELRRRFAAILRRGGLPPIRFHDLRHSCASLLLAQGVPARVVMDVLGHSTISVTMNTYSHVLASLRTEAAEAMTRVLGTPSV